ncbi:hypothetical protein SAMN04488104_10439 [Algoriphagus faecimaris]|uniref:Uncharacterized protein n=1 Tax=Algoriphagus faecimaris TaxID=686796 RepID=A0A1G6WCQ7_9BACT|nr:hypothetical protein [Algoriphagus faecimaris]SDD63608.1 hypothetical protein SAMN04488104_10439 [Algoriphagus faecimaris]
MKRLKNYVCFMVGFFCLCSLQKELIAQEKIYEACPNMELSYSIIDEETKMCGNSGMGGSGSQVTFLVCNPDPVQCCPGLDFEPEPSCFG